MRLTKCERRWRQCTHTHTLQAHTAGTHCRHKHSDMDGVIEWVHDLVSDKCSRITESQCDEIISNQPITTDFFAPQLRLVSCCRRTQGECLHFGALTTKQWSTITSPTVARQRKWQMCAGRCVFLLCFRAERSDNYTPFQCFNEETFLSWPEHASVVFAKKKKGCFWTEHLSLSLFSS